MGNYFPCPNVVLEPVHELEEGSYADIAIVNKGEGLVARYTHIIYLYLYCNLY